MSIRPLSARAAIVGTSRWAARRSIAIERVPLAIPAPSQMRTGCLPKYVNGSEFCAIAVIPSASPAPVERRMVTGLTRYWR